MKMKDITFYFKNSAAPSEPQTTEIQSVSKRKPKRNRKPSSQQDVLPNTSKSNTNETITENPKQLRNKQKPPKNPSPTVDLNKSIDDFEPTVKTYSKKRKRSTALSEDVSSPPVTPQSENVSESPPKSLNVFQFMMESRQKVIGSNSPGKKLAEVEIDDVLDQKENLKARRVVFERWAERKGSLEKKEADKQVGLCVERKLRKRAKRLKGLLGVSECDVQLVDSDCETSPKVEELVTERLESSKSSGKNVLDTENSPVKKKKSHKNKRKKRESESSNCSPWKMKIKLLHDSEVNTDGNVCVISSSDDDEIKTKAKSNVKLAPIFRQKTKTDSSEIEAKKNFLQSGIPDNLKRFVTKQTTYLESETITFPITSHVQQLTESVLWTLTPGGFKIQSTDDAVIEPTPSLHLGQVTKAKDKSYRKRSHFQTVTLKDDKTILKKLEEEYPSYPVNDIFTNLKSKQGNSTPKATKKKRKPKTHDSRMWTEKYKPTTSTEILGNNNSVEELKKWLSTWLSYKKATKSHDDSESEFDTGESNSSDNNALSNAIIITGPTGSGKTMSVHAVCNELNINVLELNASTRRTGKRLLQELQEATQSKHLKHTPFRSYPTLTNTEKISLLLVDDVDVVFEQDDGFIPALSNLLLTSKRPVVLVATDVGSAHMQRFVDRFEVVQFRRPKARHLAVWLRVLCGVEGRWIAEEWRGVGDVRQALLQTQFLTNISGDVEDEGLVEEDRVGRGSVEDFVCLDVLGYGDGWGFEVKDSLCLDEVYRGYNEGEEVLKEISGYILDKTAGKMDVRITVKSSTSERWRKVNENFNRALPLFGKTDRTSTYLDYLPALRTISRSESLRAQTTHKRRNRFYHYFQGLGIECDENALKAANEMFRNGIA